MIHESGQAMEQPLLRVSGLRKSYDNKQVLSGVEFELRPGEVLGLVGQNGAGKSTLAHLLAGTDGYDEGTIECADSRERFVSLIEQRTSIPNGLSVMEALFRKRDTTDVPFEDLLRTARLALFQTGIALDLEEQVESLSAYDKRLLEVVRILADPHPVTVMDEVGEVFNAREKEDLHFALKRCTENQGAVVYITHNLADALQVCDRIAVLRDGVISKILEAGSTTEEELSEAIYDRVFEVRERQSHATEDVVLSVRSPGGQGTRVSFDLHRGEVLGFIGSRASGVEELFRALNGKTPCEALTFYMADEWFQITTPSDATMHRIGILTGLDDDDAEEFFARNLMIGSSVANDREVLFAKQILMMIRDSEQMSRRLLRNGLSHGQHRRRVLTEQVATEATVLVLSNPTHSLDLAAQEEFWQSIEERTAAGLAVILFSSNEAELQRNCDRLIVLREGKAVETWNPATTPLTRFQDVTREMVVTA
ncbi:ATP-binding cassette domain-containing protein [Tessaracoccus sp. OH4464_COT-324]|uniref:ATP-binding cassette domain-containing protein n=1 Tax=Tessaracoccus sp. OH4464_COT-324 TaxID=2491059 RepID=UPI000F63EC18|nr:ATP-binding cassette domain-containing protein [Tessaracoccus sp. OH4464_COT-324]RRD45976.1 sugar ABC transporter ATP-binding protein [Tessaracoccus sp. OH4464_COT-324]